MSAEPLATIVLPRSTLRELRASLSGIGALADAESREETSEALEALGRQLGALLPPSSRGEGDRFHLELQDQASMALPWELAIDGESRERRYRFAPGSAALIRREVGLRSPGLSPSSGPGGVTLLAEVPIHFGLSDLSPSVAAIEEIFARGGTRSSGGALALTVGNLGSEVPPGRAHRVLHLLGHGYETSGIDARFEYGMHCASLRDSLPEDAYGEAPAGRIAEALARHAPVEALLLDACYTGGGCRWDGERWRDPLSVHAATLGASVVVSFFEAMKTAKARAFVQSFYDRLLAGDPPLAAALAARDALFLAEAGGPLHESSWWQVRIAAGS